MADPERLQRVAKSLADAINAGASGKKVKLPVIQRADAAGLIDMLHAQLDDAIARRDTEIGDRLACHKGCSACCRSSVLVTEGEAVAIAEWLRDPAHASERANFETRFVEWRERIGDLFGGGETGDPDAHREWMANVQRREAMCAFNEDGACTVYAVRPTICRKTHALDTNANCISETVPAKAYQHPETEALYEQQRPFRFALHKALRPNHRLDLLCSSVKRALAAGTVVGRNDPCPCGSGEKYKKCCGT